jgi:hypothetical protein
MPHPSAESATGRHRVPDVLPVSLGFGTIRENGSRDGAVALALASWVAVSPVDYPGPSNPNAGTEEIKRAENQVEQRLKELLAAGRVIDVEP